MNLLTKTTKKPIRLQVKSTKIGTFFKLLFLVIISVIAMPALAGPGRTTYQAKIMKPDGYPLESSSVNFRFTILDPAGTCILYSENYSAVNMGATGGIISFSLGTGVKTFPINGTTFEQVFSNVAPTLNCAAGGPASYSPIATDTRKIVMQFNDGNGWQTLPAMNINAVPYAMYANESQTLQGMDASEFVQVSTLTSCLASQALSFNGAGFSCINVGDSGASAVTSGTIAAALGYMPAVGTSFTSISNDINSVSSSVYAVSSTVTGLSTTVTNLTATVSGLLTGIISDSRFMDMTGVVSGAQYSKVTVDGKGRVISGSQITAAEINSTLAVPTCGVNQYLSFNGASYVCATDAGASGTITSISATGVLSATAGSNPVLSLNYNSDFTISSSALSLMTTGVAPGTYVKMTIDSKGRVVSSSALTAGDVITALSYTPVNPSSLGGFAYLNSLDLGSASATGILAAARLPSFSGDVISASGTSNLTLSNSGVSAGVYSKITVDAKGRVTSATNLVDTDIITALGYTPAQSGVTNSQWITSGTNISYFSGGVGIGTSSPTSALTVSGTIRILAGGGIQFPDGSIQTTALVSGSVVSGTSDVLGVWEAKALSTSYQADSDGLVVAYVTAGANSAPYIFAYTDSNPTPTTLRTSAGDANVSSLDWPTPNSLTMPVKRGDYWRVVRGYYTGGSSTVNIFWIPLAGGGSSLVTSATATSSGFLTAADWNLFNSKLSTVDLSSTSATGTLSPARLPAFSGDVSSSAASSTLNVVGLRGISLSATAPSSGQVLTFNGSQWVPTTISSIATSSTSTTPSAYATIYKTSTQTFAAAGTWYDITLDGEGLKQNITHSNVTNPARVQVITSGLYKVTYSANFKGGNGTAGTRLYKNGTSEIAATFQSAVVAGTDYSSVVGTSVVIMLSAGDYLTLQGTVNNLSGITLATFDGAPTTRTSAVMTITSLDGGSGGSATLSGGVAGYLPVWASSSTLSNSSLFSSGTNVGIGTASPASALDVSGTLRVSQICDRNGNNCQTISSGWGGAGTTSATLINASVSRNTATIYQAATDGLVVGVISANLSGACYIVGYTDTNANPTTAKSAASAFDNDGVSLRSSINSFSMPVRAGDYYKVLYTTHTGSCNVTLDWVPLAGNIAASGAGTVSQVTAVAPLQVVSGTTTPQLSLITAGSVSGQTLRFDGTNWQRTKLIYTDLINSVAASPWPVSSCAAGQAVTWNSATDSFACSDVQILSARIPATNLASNVSGGVTGILPIANGGTGLSSVGVSGTVLSSNGVSASWVSLDQLTSGANNSMVSGWPDAIVCNDGSQTRIAYYTLSSAGITTYRTLMNNANDLFVQYNNGTGAFSAHTQMAGYDCVTNAWSITQLKNLGKTFNFAKGPAGQWLASGTSTYLNTGNVGIGTNSPMVPLSVTTPVSAGALHPYRAGIQASGEGTDVTGRISARVASSIETPLFMAYKSSGTLSAPTALASGQQIAGLLGFAYNGTDYVGGGNASITFWSTQNQTVSAAGSRISFATTNNDTLGTTEKMVIEQNGNVGIGTASPTTALTVSGTVRSLSGGFQFPDGTLQATSATNSPIFAAFLNQASSAAAGVITKIPFNAEEYDTDNFFNTTTSRFQPTRAGYYRIDLTAMMNGAATGGSTYSLYLYKNGVNYKYKNTLLNYNAGFSQSQTVSTLVYMNGSTDYLEGYYYWNGGTISLEQGNTSTSFVGQYVRP